MSFLFTCPHCGTQTNVSDQYAGRSGPCATCGKTVTALHPSQLRSRPVFADLGDNAGIRMLLPVGRSGWAIAAGYAGLFAVLVFPAPIALLLGIIAIIAIKRNPHKHGMGRAIFGVVMGTIFTALLVVAIIGSMVAS